MKPFEINCDLGENSGNDAALMPYLHACSIACGGHTGDEKSMHEAVLLAKKHGVSIGAHPSFPDIDNFGRKTLNMQADDLTQSLRAQIRALSDICGKLGVTITHVKLHGALYNLAAKDRKVATIVLKSIQELKNCVLYAPWNSVITRLAANVGIRVKIEGFADRRYNKDLTLVSREHPEAVITDPKTALEQVLNILQHHQVHTLEHETAELHADTFCVHGDNPEALALVKTLKDYVDSQ